MSSVKQFELFHGLALVKLLRSDHPTTLRMIETNTKEEWSTYTINDDTHLLLKHSTKPSRQSKKTGANFWTFNFTPAQLAQLRKKDHRVVLVCGFQDVKFANKMQTCLPKPEQIQALLDLSSPDNETRIVTVQWEKGKSLRVSSNRAEKTLVVPRYAFSRWEIPGS